jgi:hypothetical protein
MHYIPGRFAELFEQPFAKELWSYLTEPLQVQAMAAAIDAGKPAIEPLLAYIENRFESPLASSDYPPDDVGILVNNMIKQIMEAQGYEHCACGLCRGRFIRQSGVYRRAGAGSEK